LVANLEPPDPLTSGGEPAILTLDI
jgi:hypothetical protein